MKRHLLLPIAGATFFRTILNTAKRFAYPFAPVLSRGLGVPLSAITTLLAINQATSVLGLLAGPLSDRLGYRKGMIAGMAMLGVGMLAAALLPFYGVVLVALFLAGLGKSVFDPAVQAWACGRVSYHRRAMVIGVLEIAWSASTLIGIPLVALLMDRYGWRSPFLVMGLLGCVGTAAIWVMFPVAEDRTDPATPSGYWRSLLGLIGQRPALGALGYALFVSAANDNLFVVYGAWLESRFGLGIVAIGLGTSVIGVAELAGEGLTAIGSDRFGIKRSVIAGLGLSMIGYLLLPFLEGGVSRALLGLGFLFFIYEFTLVSSLSLCTELLPDNRATMMAGFFAAAGVGRVVGALTGGVVWQHGGMAATATVSAVLTVFGLSCMLYGLRKR